MDLHAIAKEARTALLIDPTDTLTLEDFDAAPDDTRMLARATVALERALAALTTIAHESTIEELCKLAAQGDPLTPNQEGAYDTMILTARAALASVSATEER